MLSIYTIIKKLVWFQWSLETITRWSTHILLQISHRIWAAKRTRGIKINERSVDLLTTYQTMCGHHLVQPLTSHWPASDQPVYSDICWLLTKIICLLSILKYYNNVWACMPSDFLFQLFAILYTFNFRSIIFFSSICIYYII